MEDFVVTRERCRKKLTLNYRRRLTFQRVMISELKFCFLITNIEKPRLPINQWTRQDIALSTLFVRITLWAANLLKGSYKKVHGRKTICLMPEM